MNTRALYGLVVVFWLLTISQIPNLWVGALLCAGGLVSTVALITREAKRNSRQGFDKGYAAPHHLNESENE